MPTRPLVTLVAMITLSVAFAGCLKGGDTPADDDGNATQQAGIVDKNDTVAPDGRGNIAAFEETNKTEKTGIGAMVHEHDYWLGKERLDNVMWIDSGLIPFPLMPCAKPDNSCTVGSSETYPPLTAIADYDFAAPPEMGMVYEGTKQIEVKLTKFTGPTVGAQPAPTPANPLGKVYFDYLAANDEPGKFRKGGELKLDSPFVIDIQPTDADMPHQTKSLFIFRIYSSSEMVWFEFNITISLLKGYDVVNWPPHPDLYADKTERVVFEGPVKLASKGSIDGILFGSDAGWTSPQKVISWGSDRVEIAMTNVQFHGQADALAPKGFVLEYRNASTPFLMANGVAYGGRLDDPSSSGAEYHFTIDLTQDRGDAYDTPYAQYSRWGFRLAPYWEDTAVGKCVDELFFPGILFGCQWYPWDMTYDMKVVAYGHSTAEGVPASAT